jgi:hypothetical protein
MTRQQKRKSCGPAGAAVESIRRGSPLTKSPTIRILPTFQELYFSNNTFFPAPISRRSHQASLLR